MHRIVPFSFANGRGSVPIQSASDYVLWDILCDVCIILVIIDYSLTTIPLIKSASFLCGLVLMTLII